MLRSMAEQAPSTPRLERGKSPRVTDDPFPAVSFIRSLRSALYRAISPLDDLQRRLRRQKTLPPLWLRRHTGSPRRFFAAARDTANLIDRLELIAPDSRILDIGCGCGAMASALVEQLGEEGRYLGFDVHAPSIRWCQRHLTQDPRLVFEVAEIDSPYSTSRSTAEAKSYRFPAEDGEVDLVLAKSVFTHLLAAEASHYLCETARVLSPKGHALLTFFLFDEALDTPTPAFPYAQTIDSPLRWRRKKHPHAAVAYSKNLVERWIEEAGMTIIHFIPGFFPGKTKDLPGQDQIIFRRR